MVLIQRSTLKIVVIHESSREYWFLPRGRKDLGETLEAAALREAFEEAPDVNLGYEYLMSWYIGQIQDDAIPEKGTGMADEENYVSYLLTYEEAMKRLWGSERDVLSYAWAVFLRTLEIEEALAKEVEREKGIKQPIQERSSFSTIYVHHITPFTLVL
ncbi:hypothetical protein P691DRAFT_789100 [Macrolepiota fuliginosa MF-IS2]|uniref:Nudix hydrolase domain-containing protein n=1 Tax=Macrolepiota fuliginosa MF-IS2 TaxID=1400762 RepID=A0A9P6C665_9AGAR|nr:hypothetical protein P691DRAFT_789100 [Macrolepiota fuliginosa MF-IS2]